MAQPAPFSNPIQPQDILTPEQIAQNRKLGQTLMMQGISADPVQHWTQGLARVLQGGIGRMHVNAADEAQKGRSTAMTEALQNSGILKGLGPGDTAILGSSPEILDSAYKAALARKMNPTQGMPPSVLEFQYGQQNPQFLEFLRQKKAREAEYGKTGAIFQGEDGQFYSIQFGSDGQRRIEPVTRDGRPLRPAKGVKQVGDELVDIGTGAPVRNVAPQIENKEAAEEIGKRRGQAIGDLPRIIDNAQQAIDTIQQIRNHPGKKYGIGVPGVLGPIPGTDQAGFIDLVDQAKGKAFLEAFNSLRGGGQITEVEGKKATDAIARLQRARKPADFDKALSDLEAVIQAGLIRAYRSAGARPPQGPTVEVPAQPVAAPPQAPPVPLPKERRVYPTPTPEVVQELLRYNSPADRESFDRAFGPGAAEAYLKGRR